MKFIRALFCAALLALAGLPAKAQVTPSSNPFPLFVNALSTTVTTIKAKGGFITWIQCYNPNAAVSYLQFFDTVGAVTLGTTMPKAVIAISSTLDGPRMPTPFNFVTGLKVAATTTATGSTAPGTALGCTFGYN